MQVGAGGLAAVAQRENVATVPHHVVAADLCDLIAGAAAGRAAGEQRARRRASVRDCAQGLRKAELGEQPLVWLVGEQGVERRGAGRVRAVGLVGGVRVAARNRPRVELPDGVDELGAAAETDLKSIMYSGYGDKTVLHAASSAQYYTYYE